jgi:nucleoside 2-deoxyribosyltransferase
VKVYFAGPLFTTGERDFNAAVVDRLRAAGYAVFLPQDKETSADDPGGIFRHDIAHLEWSSVVVGIMDGPDPDSGTAWEIGYAYATGRPIILLRTDFRTGRDEGVPYNLMLTQSATEHIELAIPTVDAAATALIAALERVERRGVPEA